MEIFRTLLLFFQNNTIKVKQRSRQNQDLVEILEVRLCMYALEPNLVILKERCSVKATIKRAKYLKLIGVDLIVEQIFDQVDQSRIILIGGYIQLFPQIQHVGSVEIRRRFKSTRLGNIVCHLNNELYC